MIQTRINDPRTPEELEALLDKANGVIAELEGQLAKKDATIERLIEENVELRAEIKQLRLEMEAIGAGGVSSQRITGTGARWYAVGADGMATLCINREDARDTAAEAAQLYPNNAPYTAVQMVPVGEGEAFWGRP